MPPDRVALSKQLLAAFLIARALACGLIVVAGPPVLAAGLDPQAPSAAQAAATPSPPSTPASSTPAKDGTSGTDTCLVCHDTQSLHSTPHWQSQDPGIAGVQAGLRDVSRAGQAHVDDPTTGIKRFGKLPPRSYRDVSQVPQRFRHAMWSGSAHSARNLACTTCHSVHSPKSERAQLVKATVIETCATCHKPQVDKQQRSAHMPVREGKMDCTTCHNPHGSTNVQACSRPATTSTRACVSCHAEKRGPFLWDHAAGRESCTTCHDPHGSNNDRMLVAKRADAVPALPHRHAASFDDLRRHGARPAQQPADRPKLRELPSADSRVEPSVWQRVRSVTGA